MRVVFDTNVLIDGIQDDFSAASRLIEAVRDGEITAVASRFVEKEYRFIIPQRITDKSYWRGIEDFFNALEVVRPTSVDVVIDDAEDKKIVAAAVGGQADIIITSDRHLLDIGEVDKVRMVTPTEAWRIFEEDTGGSSQWQEFVKGLGIGA